MLGMIELKSDDKSEQSSVYSIIQVFSGHRIYWGMIELKSDDKSEKSSVYILSLFSI